jgi:hypothetical protein
MQTGELRGGAPRNIFQSDIPKVKAYDGHLPQGVQGFEFETSVSPDTGCVPGKPTWSNGRPGVMIQTDVAVIEVHVLKQNVLL